MLYLTRKVGETVIINNNIEVTIVEVKGKTVKVGFSFPQDVSVLRKETHEKILQENLAASTSTPDLEAFTNLPQLFPANASTINSKK